MNTDSEECPADDICDGCLDFFHRAVKDHQVRANQAPPCLVSLGLLQPIVDEPGQLSVIPPSSAAAVALRPYENAMAETTRRIESLSAAYRQAEAVFNTAQQGLIPETVTLRGSSTINRVVDLAVTDCLNELMTMQPGGARPTELLDALVARSLETIRRGVHQRTIYQHAVRSHRPTLDYAIRIMSAGAEIRTVDKVFDRLIICDRKVCFIPNAGDDESALEIRNEGVVNFLVKVFEHTWDRAIAIDVSSGVRPIGVLSDIELSVARMIVSGSTEDKIARNLGISRRTVAEYASRLARHLGSSSRAQLGYLIATHGLLDESKLLPVQRAMLG
ncbi:LuxR family transcriptional regulator [Actinoplanes capillaceus]|uniref:LuxR family transcriptional regulator n=1 Tax=Actinoplanes campanulatus TaxID=113559 RepID=A0ABQ3WUM3_9ACTN|nr:LuxR C-terminal-related transcriptional regulator [Actinoplanes capillaceus]GID50008.1 LuxR family transcriptional regulator [Actinoplanes capillaceus]